MLLLLLLVPCLAELDRFSTRQVNNPNEFAKKHHFKHIARVAGFDIFESTSRTRNLPEGLTLEKKRLHYKRGGKDPLYPSQFHLHGNPYSVNIGKVRPRGDSVHIAIVDDGVQHQHPDLQLNYNAELSYDFNGHDNDPEPYYYDSHGTACAGVCCAVENTVCGRGVASNASIVGIRLIAAAVYDYEEAQALSHHSDKIRIYSNSWGPYDDGMDLSGPGLVLQHVLKMGYESGHNMYLWAGGNGRQHSDMSNYDGYANSPYTLAIAANDHKGEQAWYSESGANLFASVPSSGAGKSISTTGMNGGCTRSFGGTSSAAPLAAGVIAILLQERPELKMRDIQHLVARHALKTLKNGRWSRPNKRNFTHCNEFGFGLLDVPTLLQALPSHQLVEYPVRRMGQQTSRGNQIMPVQMRIKAPNSMSFVEQVLITVKMNHQRRGQVNVSVKSKKTTSILAAHRGDTHSGESEWTYSSLRHWGEEVQRGDQWIVNVWDDTSDSYGGSVEFVKIEWLGGHV